MTLSQYLSRNFALTAMLSATSVLIPLTVSADPSTSPSSTAKSTPAAPTPKPEPSKPDATSAQAAPSRDDMKARMKADRDAFFSARLAALHAGLQLTPDQQSLWPPVETAIRDLVTLRRSSWHRREQDQDQKAGSSINRLTARGEHLEQMGSALKKLAAATGPLVGSLTADQKERLPMLLRGVRPGRVMARAFDLQDDRMERAGGDRAGGMRREGMDRGESRDRTEGGMDRNGMDRGGMGSSRMGSSHMGWAPVAWGVARWTAKRAIIVIATATRRATGTSMVARMVECAGTIVTITTTMTARTRPRVASLSSCLDGDTCARR